MASTATAPETAAGVPPVRSGRTAAGSARGRQRGTTGAEKTTAATADTRNEAAPGGTTVAVAADAAAPTVEGLAGKHAATTAAASDDQWRVAWADNKTAVTATSSRTTG
jgi:hypothetical protein